MLPSREDDQSQIIVRLERELHRERVAHEQTLERLACMTARARAWRRVAEWIYQAHQKEQ